MTEENMFGSGKYQNWTGFYPRIRSDLYFVMDDSWDVDFKNYDYGADLLNPARFPTYASSGTEQEKFRKLNAAVQAKGWRAVGGWIAANKAKAYQDMSDHDFYAERLKWMEAAGWGYLKVDWGSNSKSEKWRRQLTEWGHQYAPNIYVEQAMIWSCVPFSDVFRTYDIEAITSIPVTLSRVCDGIKQVAEPGAKGLINCEDEPVIGAALGCAIGIMRHPFVGNLPDGQQDYAFPPVARDLKRCVNEVERAVLWHRVAPPFRVDGQANIDDVKLNDSWCFQEREGWSTKTPGKWSRNSAPARITRGGLPLPTVKVESGEAPFVIASRHPNGVLTVATLGRTICASPTDRKYGTPLADITLEAGKLTDPIGIFGHYQTLTLSFDTPMKGRKVLAQDILDHQAKDITAQVVIKDNTITLPGKLIDRIGLEKADHGDKSDPGMVISILDAK
ncbi:hypothetical protein [Haloferula sp. BvORR071]|uniref:hypothetical protein n=1 Tax=Haloferula sp. BvORR071 TaxID=1396141 RepID=UPI0022410056|nr:hypothetical protein [Haloferula sp. BvORR071]